MSTTGIRRPTVARMTRVRGRPVPGGQAGRLPQGDSTRGYVSRPGCRGRPAGRGRPAAIPAL